MNSYRHEPELLDLTHRALARILDIEFAIMLHIYREDLLAQ